MTPLGLIGILVGVGVGLYLLVGAVILVSRALARTKPPRNRT